MVPWLRDVNGMRAKGGRKMSEMRELTTAVKEVAILSEKSDNNANNHDK